MLEKIGREPPLQLRMKITFHPMKLAHHLQNSAESVNSEPLHLGLVPNLPLLHRWFKNWVRISIVSTKCRVECISLPNSLSPVKITCKETIGRNTVMHAFIHVIDFPGGTKGGNKQVQDVWPTKWVRSLPQTNFDRTSYWDSVLVIIMDRLG